MIGHYYSSNILHPQLLFKNNCGCKNICKNPILFKKYAEIKYIADYELFFQICISTINMYIENHRLQLLNIQVSKQPTCSGVRNTIIWIESKSHIIMIIFSIAWVIYTVIFTVGLLAIVVLCIALKYFYKVILDNAASLV